MAPSIMSIAHAVVQMFYGLSDKKCAEIKAELAEREKAEVGEKAAE